MSDWTTKNLTDENARLRARVSRLEDRNRQLLAKIQSEAPVACGLEDCGYLNTAVRVLLDFSWRAVNGMEDKA